MISQTLDVSSQFLADQQTNFDVSGWDYIVVQVIMSSGTLTFKTTNDGGEVTGSADSNAISAANWQICLGTNLATDARASTATANSMFKFNVVGRYFQLSGASVVSTKVILELSKID